MSIRLKALLAVGLTLSAVLFVLYFLFATIILQGFEKIEHQTAHKDVQRAQRALTQMIDNLSSKLVDWAIWDDSYRFMIEQYPEYIESNLTYESLVGTELSQIIFINTDNKIIAGHTIDRQNSVLRALDREVQNVFTAQSAALNVQSAFSKESTSGLMQIGSDVVIFAAQQILKSDGSGPAQGVIIFTRYITEDTVLQIAELANAKVSVQIIKNLPSSSETTQIIQSISKHFKAAT
jgi:sensor domain CHASE-containing protein